MMLYSKAIILLCSNSLLIFFFNFFFVINGLFVNAMTHLEQWSNSYYLGRVA